LWSYWSWFSNNLFTCSTRTTLGFDITDEVTSQQSIQLIETLSTERLSISTSHVVQLLGIRTRSDTHNNNRNTGRPHLVRNIPGILGVLRRRLRSVGQQDDNLLCTGACAVGFSEEFVLCHAEGFIDTSDGSHQRDAVDGLIEVRFVVEIIEGDGEFGVV